MSFREQLEKAYELKLNICDLTIANECECVFTFEYTEHEFEQLCSLAREIYLKSYNLNENAIALAINDLIVSGDKTIKQVLSMGKWELGALASSYM